MNRPEPIESLERRTYFSKLTFAPAVHFAAGANPTALVTADLTGNGLVDVITSNYTSASISVLRGNGNGTFQSPVQYAVGASPQAIAQGDFNGDGKPDIVTANAGGNSISVLLGNGDGTFANQVTYAVGVRPQAIAVADLNGDGLPDIVTADEGSSSVSVLLNTGAGQFAPAISYFTGQQPDGVAIGDLNGDSKPDIVTVNPLNNTLHVLLNRGDGSFTKPGTYLTGMAGRAIGIADLNSDGRPDLVTANLHNTSVSVLIGNGDGTFQSDQQFASGTFPFSVAFADLNGDGRTDIITANNYDNQVGVLLHVAGGGFTETKPFKVDKGPTDAVAADVNGDGKPDLISTDFNTSTISVLVNQTVFVPLVSTTATLSPGQNPVQVGNRLQLSVQITPASLAKTKPAGVVQFFDGAKVIGVVKVSPTGTAKLAIKSLALGTHQITAHYGGDGVYAQSLSQTIAEVVAPASQVSPLISPQILAVHLPGTYVAGDLGTIDVALDNIGAGTAIGSVRASLYGSLNGSFDSTAFAIPIQGNPVYSIRLAGGTSRVVGLRFAVPANLAAANYTFFVALSAVSGLTTDQVVTTPAIGATTAQSVFAFGTVGKHRNYRLTRDENGTLITLALAGSGTGTLTENSAGHVSLSLTGTTAGSQLQIIGSGVSLDSLTSTGPMGNVIAQATIVTGNISLPGVRNLTIAGATQSNIVISGGTPNTLSLGMLSGVNLYSAAPILSLSVSSYSNSINDAITTAWIGKLTSAGDFGAHLMTNGGRGGRNIGLASASIAGSLLDSVWSINANVTKIQTGTVAAGWVGTITGNLASLTDNGDFAGQLQAHTIRAITIDGNLLDSARFVAAHLPAKVKVHGAEISTAGNPNFVG